jgi:hypothetical protein
MSRGLPDFKYYLVSRRGTSGHTRAHDEFKTNCTMVETIVVNGLTTNLTDTWCNNGNARPRQRSMAACVHRLEVVLRNTGGDGSFFFTPCQGRKQGFFRVRAVLGLTSGARSQRGDSRVCCEAARAAIRFGGRVTQDVLKCTIAPGICPKGRG